MKQWKENCLSDIANINPSEKLAKGTLSSKISMDNLSPFCKKPLGKILEAYNGGAKFRNGDTLIARITPCLENGKTAYVSILDEKEIGFGSTEYIVLRAIKQKSDSEFLYYFARSDNFRDVAIASMTGSSGRQRVQIDVVRDYVFTFPPLPEQKAIASVLSSLDDKIDLLHCQNKTLESMAETLFRQWFILDSTGTPVNLDHVIDFNPKRKINKNQDATYLDMAGLSTDTFCAKGYYKRPFSSGTKFSQQDTLLARITPCLENGKAAYIDFLDEKETGWGSTEFIVMRPKKEIHPLLSYIMCRNLDFKEYAESCMEGSTGRQRVNLEHLKKFNVNLPTAASLRIINELLGSFESKLINNSQQIDSLEKLRDTLLPKLMSGEVRVQYAEEAIASVA